MRIFAGNANRSLAEAIAQSAGTRLGEMTCDRFPDGEVKVQVHEDVRGRDVFVVQSTYSNDFLMELLVIVDAMRRASAKRITAVVPFFGYARQDRKPEGRVPITAKLVANLMATAGIDRLLTIDLHAMQLEGFFDLPVDHLRAQPLQLDYVRSLGLQDPVVLCTDTGGIKIADYFSRKLSAGLAIIYKRRLGDNHTEVAHVVGSIGNRDVILVDDMISTAGSMAMAIRTAKENGARRVLPIVTHAVFCGEALERLEGVGLTEIVITDTIPLRPRYAVLPVTVLSTATMLAEAINRIHTNRSISQMFG